MFCNTIFNDNILFHFLNMLHLRSSSVWCYFCYNSQNNECPYGEVTVQSHEIALEKIPSGEIAGSEGTLRVKAAFPYC